MVLNHVAQGPGRFVIGATTLDTNCLGIGDLNMVDILPVPQRLKNAIGKPKDEQILYCLFAEVMIDAIDLTLIKNCGQRLVQCPRAFQVPAKRFLYDNTRPGFLRGCTPFHTGVCFSGCLV